MHLIQAIKAFFRVFIQGEEAAAAAVAPPPETAFHGSTAPAVQVLALLQKEGRLVDFLMEDISSYSDADVGAAVRQIHTGCRKVLDDRFRMERILPDDEGAKVEVPADFNASAISIVGNVSGQPPYQGTLSHRGWRAAETHLPTVPAGADQTIIAPAEVEIG